MGRVLVGRGRVAWQVIVRCLVLCVGVVGVFASWCVILCKLRAEVDSDEGTSVVVRGGWRWVCCCGVCDGVVGSHLPDASSWVVLELSFVWLGVCVFWSLLRFCQPRSRSLVLWQLQPGRPVWIAYASAGHGEAEASGHAVVDGGCKLFCCIVSLRY